MHFYKFIAIFATVGFLEAKVIPGKCPAVSTMLDFDPTPVIIVKYKQGYPRIHQISHESIKYPSIINSNFLSI